MTSVLCITANYPPHHLGGYEVSCRDVMSRLVERGHRVTVLTSDDRLPGVEDPPEERAASPAVRRDIIRYFRDEDLWHPPWPARWKVERHNQRVLAEAIAAAAPDVLAIWHIGAMSLGLVTAAVESGIPVVYGISDDWLSYAPRLDPWTGLMERLGPLARPLRAALRVPTVVPDLGASGAFCFISECTRRRALEFGRWRYPRSGIVYSGIDRSLFAPRDPAPPWTWRLLYVGRLDKRKGIDTVIRALALLPPEATLQVDGGSDEVERARLDSIAAELGVADRITFSRVPRAELPGLYRAADVVVFPSEWEEPFGLVPVEAMECGVPVVGTGVGGSGEFLLDRRNCVRFTAGDPASLAAALERLATDADLRARLVEAGYDTARYFDVERLTDAYEAWHDAAVAGYRHGEPASREFRLDGDGGG